jgi:uroporphyrinogen decarboxylase
MLTRRSVAVLIVGTRWGESSMNAREKFHAVMSFQDHASILKAEFGYWAGTIRRWFEEGLPKRHEIPEQILDGDLVRGGFSYAPESHELVDRNVMPELGLDSYLSKFPVDVSPPLSPELLEDTDEYRIVRDRYGITKKQVKGSAATHLNLEFPIKNRNDLYNYIERYDRNMAKRLPPDIDSLKSYLKNRDFPIRLGGNPFGFSFLPRFLMGDVQYMLSLYDDPDCIKELNRFFLDFVKDYWSHILTEYEVDCVFILEDMAYRGGSMISPQMFEEFMAPYYRELVSFVKGFGVEYVFVDCDGLVEELIPLWVEVGVNGLFPLEALNDIVAIREAYPSLRLLGGVDKTTLFTGKHGLIDAELRRIQPVIRSGGFIPHIDHAVSQDIGWKSFTYYRKRLDEIVDAV